MKPTLFDKVKETIRDNSSLNAYNVYLMFVNKYGVEKVGDWELYRHKESGYWNSKENVLRSAQLFDSVKEWKQAFYGAAYSAKNNGWFQEATSHMVIKKGTSVPAGYWKNKENVISSARNHTSIKSWTKAASRAVIVAREKGWFEEATSHMEKNKAPSVPLGYWQSKENVLESARKYRSYTEWRSALPGAVQAARKFGWLEEARSHMNRQSKPTGYWKSKDNVIASVKGFKTVTQWQKAYRAAYESAKRNHWISECLELLEVKPNKVPQGYWKIKENVAKSAEKCSSRTEWAKRYGAAYKVARDSGWMDEMTSHMKGSNLTVEKGYWNVFENVMASALKCSTKTEWNETFYSAANSARRNGWYEKCTEHMSNGDYKNK